MAGREVTDQTLESQPVALGAESRHHAHRQIGEYRPASLRLAREDVRQVHFHERHPHREQRVPHRQARVREGSCVDQRAVGVARNCWIASPARLRGCSASSCTPRPTSRAFARDLLDLRQRRATVQLRLALAQEIEIGPFKTAMCTSL